MVGDAIAAYILMIATTTISRGTWPFRTLRHRILTSKTDKAGCPALSNLMASVRYVD
jgi:hypothetical protein